jgi:hypothetical protein
MDVGNPSNFERLSHLFPTYEFFKKHEILIEQYARDWGDVDWNFIPEEHQFFSPGSPYDCSDLGHQTGATMDNSSYIIVENQNGEEIFNSELDPNTLKKNGVEVSIYDEVNLEHANSGTVIFWGGQGEKGCFFSGEIIIDAPFDPSKLKLSCSNLDGWLISSGIEYDDEEIDGSDGYDTTGKWGENKFCIVGDEEVYEGKERDDEGSLYSDEDTPNGYQNSPKDWEKSIKIKNVNPSRVGWYSCNWGSGTTYGSLYWNGSEWQSFSNGCPTRECKKVDWWYGYNWDTSDWTNRPTEPPECRCKKCEWLGSQDDMLRNRKGDLTCPSCKAKKDDIDWLDYDPETKKGAENRKKYCV